MQTVDHLEISHFESLSRYWWDETGPFKTLHQLNPVRIGYILRHIRTHFQGAQAPLNHLTFLDVGCGGGLLSEPFARLGARVTGLDASAENIRFAQQHAQEMGLEIHYLHQAVENIHQTFDVVCALEIIEHVKDPATFLSHCCRTVKPGGLLFLSTINRTFKAYLLAIKVAEDLINLVPKGTHQWQKFVRPKEMHRYLATCGFEVVHQTGVVVDILNKGMRLNPSMDVNYMLVARRKAEVEC